MNNFYFLNLDIPLFKEGITFHDIPKTIITIIDKEKYLNEKIFMFFDSLDLKIFFVETFFKTLGQKEVIHVDAIGGDYTKLNWVFGGGDSKMSWYSPIDKSRGLVLKTPANTRYVLYQSDDVTETDCIAIKNPTLVQVGVPHNVYDVTEDRYCVSIVFQNKNNNTRLSMRESIEKFKDYIIQSGSE